MHRNAMLNVIILMAVVVSVSAFSQDFAFPDHPPTGWQVEPRSDAGPATCKETGKRLGAQISKFSYQRISIHGNTASINFLECPDEKNAIALQRAISEVNGSGAVSRKGNVVVEVAGCHVIMAKKIRDMLGLTPAGERVWEVQARLGCVNLVNAMTASRTLDLFIQGGDEPPIRALTKDWQFGNTIRLWTGKRSWFRSEITFIPTPIGKNESDGTTTYLFRETPHQCGIPYAEFKAEIGVKNAYRPSGEKPVLDLCGSTTRWPVEKVKKLADQLTAGLKSPAEKLDAIQAYCYAEIKYEGQITGSRYGVEQVLTQKYGHCWDKSDVFVTLCRASGLPTRQIAGWLPCSVAGHVWSEVYLEKQGWIPVDPTTPWTGTSDDYIPLFSTSDGEMPFFYLSMPNIRLKE